ncbi:MAG TPA: M10 family metallopeptidase C-terminal domain-containing protein [Allosphingosinicella sp.]|nr:M10 family metallopeptidase C-terminal domain-containing protein [Allosphingosinicella sp.]
MKVSKWRAAARAPDWDQGRILGDHDPTISHDHLGTASLTRLILAAAAPAPQPVAPSGFIPSPGEPGIAPNFDTVLGIVQNYAVPLGSILYTTSLYYMVTSNTLSFRDVTFVNNGTMWNRGADSEILSSFNFGPIVNNGLMVAESPQGHARGMNITSTFTGLTNSGRIFSLSENSWATGIEDWGPGGVIENSGLIAVYGGMSAAPNDIAVTVYGILRWNGGRIVNSGSILAEGAIVYGIASTRGHLTAPGYAELADVENRGTIEARSTDPLHPSIALGIGSLESEILTVLNWGIIRGDVAIVSGGQYVVGAQREKTFVNHAGGLIDGAINLGLFGEKLDNRGRIEGDIAMAGGSDLVLNSGTIVGRVDLGSGADIWFSPTGALEGAVFGGDGADALLGSAGADMLNGEAGADVLHGGGGADQLAGGADADIFVYDKIGDSTAAAFDTLIGFVSGVDRIDLSALAVQSVGLQAGAGFTQLSAVTAGGTLVVRVEGGLTLADLILADISSIAGTANADMLHATAGGSTLSGGDGDDTLFGGTGNDRLDGGAGTDTMWGAEGDDVYVVQHYSDIVLELNGQGRDRVEVHNPEYRLPEHIEDVTASGLNVTFIYGNGLANRMTGNDAVNTFIGGGGNDVIDGGGGDDRLQGDAGADRLTGGSGADHFIYTLAGDSRDGPPRSDSKTSMPDTITDFTSGLDKIDLSEIDAVPGPADAFTFIGQNAFSGQAGQLRFEMRGGQAHIYGDVDGDAIADLHIIATTTTLVATDFIL